MQLQDPPAGMRAGSGSNFPQANGRGL